MDAYLARNRNRNIVLVFSIGHSLTHYLGVNGGQLTTMQMHTRDFEREFEPWPAMTAMQFAHRYTKDDAAKKMIPLGGSAIRVLRSILNGQSSPNTAEQSSPSINMEKEMPTETAFRKPEGSVAQIHAFLDKNIEGIKAGTTSRKELIEKLEARELNHSTIVTQCGVWARNNGVNFPRPSQAEATKAALAEEKKAAKKAAKKTATA